MSNRPFNIFPCVGYKNSQFQIITTVDDNIEIILYYQGNQIRKITVNSSNPTLILNLRNSGLYTAKCNYQDKSFEQEIEIKDAYRYGSSEFKKSFVFDDSDYSFFLMKDRLLLYFEKKNLLLTENHYSPTDIKQIDHNNFLFITKIGEINGIVNLGIYNTDLYKITGELLNDYKEICLLPKENKVWLYNIKTKNIQCFELMDNQGNTLQEKKKYENASDYTFDSANNRIYINQDDRILFINTRNLHQSTEYCKSPSHSIDKYGNLFVINGSTIQCINTLENYEISFEFPESINLNPHYYLFIGDNFKTSYLISDFDSICNEHKEYLISGLQGEVSYEKLFLDENDKIKESTFLHTIYPTHKGVFIFQEKKEREFDAIVLQKIQGSWLVAPNINLSNTFTLFFNNGDISYVKANSTINLSIINYENHCLIIKVRDLTQFFFGSEEIQFNNDCYFTFLSSDSNRFFLIKNNGQYSLYSVFNLQRPILKDIDIHNIDFIKTNNTIWYAGTDKLNNNGSRYLNAFMLSNDSHFKLNEEMAQHSFFNDSSDYKYNKDYFLSSNNVIVNSTNGEIRDAFIGYLESYSENLNKIVSSRNDFLYFSIFNTETKKYDESEIKIDSEKFKESYLNPNGQFLVLQGQTNEYILFDIEKNETIQFLAGNFIAFSKEGNLIIEEEIDNFRSAKIIDPLTFDDITPPNYHHYRFLSPDGKLYAQISRYVKFYNKLNGDEIFKNEVIRIRKELDSPVQHHYQTQENLNKYNDTVKRVKNNREQLYISNKNKFNELNITNHLNITSETIIETKIYTQIGIVGTDKTIEVLMPEDTQWYNYASFSYDNKYLCLNYRLRTSGGIHFFRILFDEPNQKIELTDSYLSRIPSRATWKGGFSKTNYFGAYDSNPDTYIIKIDEQLFQSKITDLEIENNIFHTRNNIYYTYNEWNVIKGKNFLCFSPTGEFLALSEQAYEPLTLGGYGHKESNALHIATTESGKIVDSFLGHGDMIKYDKDKRVQFVAFSEDESKIMSLSTDGVVYVREIKLREKRLKI